MSYTVKFKGGPLGGETRSFSSPPMAKLEVPALRSRSFFAEFDRSPSAGQLLYDTETYYLYATPRYGAPEFEYRWENPNQHLLNKITKLEAELQEARKDAEALDALRKLKEYL